MIGTNRPQYVHDHLKGSPASVRGPCNDLLETSDVGACALDVSDEALREEPTLVIEGAQDDRRLASTQTRRDTAKIP